MYIAAVILLLLGSLARINHPVVAGDSSFLSLNEFFGKISAVGQVSGASLTGNE